MAGADNSAIGTTISSVFNAQALSSCALTPALSWPYLKAIRLFRLSIAPLSFRQHCRRIILQCKFYSILSFPPYFANEI